MDRTADIERGMAEAAEAARREYCSSVVATFTIALRQLGVDGATIDAVADIVRAMSRRA